MDENPPTSLPRSFRPLEDFFSPPSAAYRSLTPTSLNHPDSPRLMHSNPPPVSPTPAGHIFDAHPRFNSYPRPTSASNYPPSISDPYHVHSDIFTMSSTLPKSASELSWSGASSTTFQIPVYPPALNHTDLPCLSNTPPVPPAAGAYADPRPRFDRHPIPISASPPSNFKPYNAYTAATPGTTPTKSHPSYSYHLHQASDAPRIGIARARRLSFPNFSRLSSIPNPQLAPPARPTSTPPSADSHHSHETPVSQSQLPVGEDPRSVKREDDRYADADAQQQARLIAERDATLERMEEQLEAVAARKRKEVRQRRADDERRQADEKLRRAAAAQAKEERRARERDQERRRPQTHNPAAAATDKKWYHDVFWGNGRDGRRKDEWGSERERAKSEARIREVVEARKKGGRGRARSVDSSGSVASAWAAYEKAITELMNAKSSEGKVSTNLTFYDIPWPVLSQANSFHDFTNQNIAAFLLSPHHSQGKNAKARLRGAILIWHPDKFTQNILPCVAESHRPAVVAAGNKVASIINELISSHSN